MRFLFVIGAVISLHLTNGESIEEKSRSTSSGTKDHSSKTVFHDANQFSIDLFEIAVRNISGNVLTSAHEAFICLSMATYGLQGTLKALRAEGELLIGSDETQVGYQTFVENIRKLDSSNLNTSTNVFYRNGSKLPSDFKNAMEANFLSAPQSVDFNQPEKASEIINKWAGTATSIGNLVTPADLYGNPELILVSAVHFKGLWPRPFTTLPGKLDFTPSTGKKVKVPCMKRLDFFKIGRLPRFRARFIEIPYAFEGSEAELSMFIILPKRSHDFQNLERNINRIPIDALLRGHQKELLVTMPKFNIESKITIGEPLNNTKLTRVFSDAVDSKGTVKAPYVRVSKFIQKVSIEVGAESVRFRGINASPQPGVPEFTVNHPFVIIIAATGENPSILVTGRYTGSEHLEAH